MEIMYNATGARRKELVKAVAAISGVKPVYLGTPSFSYKVGGIEVTRDGTLRLSDGRTAQPLTEALAKAGFHYEGEDAMNTAEEAGGEADADEAAQEETSQDVAAGAQHWKMWSARLRRTRERRWSRLPPGMRRTLNPQRHPQKHTLRVSALRWNCPPRR